ncbi:hypothetical protein PspR32_24980 [Pseudomonas sp. R32]|nr:hypothetical protein PspR32_24980 [Pseudomonas sp. R32]
MPYGAKAKVRRRVAATGSSRKADEPAIVMAEVIRSSVDSRQDARAVNYFSRGARCWRMAQATREERVQTVL